MLFLGTPVGVHMYKLIDIGELSPIFQGSENGADYEQIDRKVNVLPNATK
jgi:hypothetical protein